MSIWLINLNAFLTFKVFGNLCLEQSSLCEYLVYFFFNKYFYFLAVLGLCCCAWAFSGCGEQGLLFVALHRLLIAVASLVAEHGL